MRADAPIPDRTLLTEYVGDVDFMSRHKHNDSDSIMTLLNTGNERTSLVIVPDRRGNIARFLSGINNHCSASRRRQNVKSARFRVDGQVRVVLYANRDIRRGEVLFYDYNAEEKEYPTEHFT